MITQIQKKIRQIISCAILLFLASALIKSHSSGTEAFRYESRGRRDPFVSLIGPERVVVTGLEDITSIEDVSLEGICVGAQGKRIAIINGQLIKEDDKVGNLMVKKITKNSVMLSIEGKEYNLSLPEEGGIKSGK